MGMVVLIDRPGYRLAAHSNVIKSREATVVAEVSQAYAYAEQQITAALNDVEQTCGRIANDAYQDGFAKGQAEAARRFVVREADRLALLKSLQPAMVEVIVDAVSLLVKGMPREAFIARALDVSQATLRNTSWAKLRVHPTAVQAAISAVSDFDRETGLGQLVRVSADDSLSLEGCVLESEFGRVDASLGTQLEAIRGAIAHATQTLTDPGN